MNDIGSFFEEEIIYISDETSDTPENVLAFYSRVSVWTARHGVVLGEGAVRSEPCSVGVRLILKAPIKSGGGHDVVERVIC